MMPAAANGAQVEFTAQDQHLAGDIAVADNAVVTVESGSTWMLTGNSTLMSLTNNGSINYNGFTITLADGTVLSQ